MNKKLNRKIISASEIYKYLLGPLLSRDDGIDAEKLTQLALNSLEQASLRRTWPIFSGLLENLSLELKIEDQRLIQNVFGMSFNNPLGLAAGFDKNGVAAGIWDKFGFGFAELGTVTFHNQAGNPKPRLFRLAKEEAALNRMGFNNNGARAMRHTLQRQRIQGPGMRPAVIGLNFGKSKITPLHKAPEDYALALEILAPQADYAVINISSPNTPGLRDLQSTDQLKKLINRLKQVEECPPLLVKIAPDLDNNSIDKIAELALDEGLSGLIAVNTSLARFGLGNRLIKQTGKTLQEEAGGLSGAPIQDRALEVIVRLNSKVGSNLPLIGVGGINSPKSAWDRIASGASLLQIYTGWIFQGPELVPLILKGLLKQLDHYGFKNISEAVGTKAPWV